MLLLLIMLLKSLSVLKSVRTLYIMYITYLKTASNELKVRSGLPCLADEKNRIIGDLGLP